MSRERETARTDLKGGMGKRGLRATPPHKWMTGDRLCEFRVGRSAGAVGE